MRASKKKATNVERIALETTGERLASSVGSYGLAKLALV